MSRYVISSTFRDAMFILSRFWDYTYKLLHLFSFLSNALLITISCPLSLELSLLFSQIALSSLALLQLPDDRPFQTGISFKTQALYLLVFLTRYVDLLTGPWLSLYNTVMKVFFIGSSGWILYLMKVKFK